MNVTRSLALTTLLASLLFSTAAAAAPRPLSDAERAAAQIAADYLNRGPQAVADQLSATSPLRKLDAKMQLDEIEVRLGPPAGATWELETVVPAIADRTAVFAIAYPSGIDEVASIELEKEATGYKVNDIRIAGEKSPKTPIFPAEPAVIAADAAAKKPMAPAAKGMIIVGLAAALALGGIFAYAANPLLSRIATAAAIAAGIGAAAFALVHDERFGFVEKIAAEKQKSKDDGYPRLAALLPLRRAIAAGGSGEIDALIAQAPHNKTTKNLLDVWRAQWELQQTRTDAAKKTLAAFPSPSDIPLVEILRGRLALLGNDEVSAVIAYEHAVNLGPGRDGLWFETAQALAALGFDDRARDYLSRLSDIGSRSAEAAYMRAVLAASKNRDEDAEKALLEAWNLRPVERSELVEASVLWSVIRRANVATAVSLAAADESTFAAPDLATRSISLPQNAWPAVSGSFLHVQIGEQELLVPGGAAIAPVGTFPVDAAAWHRDEDNRALKQVPQLLGSGNSGAFVQPALRRRIVRAANVLAEHNRWNDVLELTKSITPSAEHIPPQLFFLRSTALEHSDRAVEARQLMIQLAGSRVLQRKNDAQSLEELGERLANLDEYDAAIKMLDKAQAVHSRGALDDRVRQIQMNKRLATAFSTYTTPHFELHYPQDVGTPFAQTMGDILEKEYARLQAFCPTPEFKRVVVNVLQWEDFRSTYTGSDFILGFYQGKITLPFGGVGRFVPEVVAILSHELLHALLAQATHDQAPHWFHEGLAQRIEMREFARNAFNTYSDDKLLAVSLIDSVMHGSPDPEMIIEGYIESQTAIRYIEARYGQAGVRKMIASFRDGATTEEAIKQLTGGTIQQFDKDLRTWGHGASRVFEGPPVIHYDGEDNSMRWTRRSS